MSKYNIDCDIVKDVLPLYVEEISSNSTTCMVETHLEDCKECREYLDKLKKNINIPVDADASLLKSFKRKMYLKKTFIIGITICCTILFMLLAIMHLVSDSTFVPYEELENLTVTAQDNGVVKVEAETYGTGGYMESYYDSSLGICVGHLSFGATNWQMLFGEKGKGEFKFEPIEGKPVECIYYTNQDTGENILIYGSGSDLKMDWTGQETETFGKKILERLYRDSYLIIAGALALVGGIVCFVFRKKKQWLVLWKITLLPVSFIISYILANIGFSKFYVVDLGDTLFITVILYLISYWILGYFIYGRKMK